MPKTLTEKVCQQSIITGTGHHVYEKMYAAGYFKSDVQPKKRFNAVYQTRSYMGICGRLAPGKCKSILS